MNELVQLDRPGDTLRRRLSAIAFLDVAGYSRLMEADEYATLDAWSLLRRTVIEPRILTWRGRVVDRAGDGIFAEFGSALEAVKWAVDVQNAVDRHVHSSEPIRLRIGLHLADVIDGHDGEVQGDGVNIAARLQSHAEVGGIIASKTLVDAVLGKTGFGFVDLGKLHLRNISNPVHAFRLELEPVRPGRVRRWWRPAAAVAGLSAVGLLTLMAFPDLQKGSRERAEQLLRQGLAMKCPEFPCPAVWLEQRSLFHQAIAADPKFARPYAEAALIYANFVSSRQSTDRKEDLRTAAHLATQAVALAPDQAFSHRARAAVLRQDPDTLEEALVSYVRVLSIDPSQTMARANAGYLLLLLGRPEEAEPYVRAALDAEPKDTSVPSWLNRMGLIELFLDRDGHGAEWFRRAIARQSQLDAEGEPGMERGINLASALALNGDIDEARRMIESLRRKYPPLSTRNIWTCGCSHEPSFKAGVERLRQGAILAGLRHTGQDGMQVQLPPLQ